MKKILLILLFIGFVKGFAQGTYTGCLYSNSVYTVVATGNKYNSNTGRFSLSVGYCSWTPSTGTACSVCIGGNGRYNGAGNCVGAGKMEVSGIKNTFTMVLCPIDNNLIILLISFLLTTAYFIKINRSILLYK